MFLWCVIGLLPMVVAIVSRVINAATHKIFGKHLPHLPEINNEEPQNVSQEEATLENLPDDLLSKILVPLPAKQLAQMRCISKSWNALLSQPSFVKSHLHHSIHNNDRILLVFEFDVSSLDDKPFVAIPCSSPHLELTNFIKLPSDGPSDLRSLSVIGSVNGLICSSYGGYIIHILNPSLSAVSTLPPHFMPSGGDYKMFFGFGFDPKNDDYKVVKVIHLTTNHPTDPDDITVKEWLPVEVYSMRKGSWGLITQRFPSSVTELFDDNGVIVDGVDGVDGYLHWLGENIVAFDLGSETFLEMPLPDAYSSSNSNRIGVLAGKLCFMSGVSSSGVCEVWVMEEHGVAESWVKRHVFSQFTGDLFPYGFTSQNEFLCSNHGYLNLYDPVSKEAKVLEKFDRSGLGRIVEYVDSLVWIAPPVR